MKQRLRQAMGVYDQSVAQIADQTDEEDSTVEQWVSPISRVNVPARIVCAGRLHRGVRAMLIAAFDELAGEAPVYGAATPEAQAACALRAAGQFVIVASPAVTADRIELELAESLLVTGEKANVAFAALCARMRGRVISCLSRAARGPS